MTPQELKNSILQLAVQGKLVEQRPEEGIGEELYQQIQAEKQQLIKAGTIKKEKPLPEIVEDEIPFDIPDSWKWYRLGELFNIVNGFTPLKSNPEFWEDGDIPWFTIEDVHRQGCFITATEKFITRKALSKNTERIVPADTVLLCCTASVGEYAYTKIPLTTNQQFNAFVLKEHYQNAVYPLYVFEYAKTLKGTLIDRAGKTTFNFVSVGKLSNMLIPLPPLAEQKRIVAKIEELLPLIDRYEQAWSKLEDFNKRFPVDMQKSILQMAIQGKLVPQVSEEGTGEELFRQIQAEKQRLIKVGAIKKEKPLPEIAEDEIPFDIPESWKWVCVGDLFQHNTGKALNSSDKSGTPMEYITTSNVYWNSFALDKLKTMLFTETEVDKCTVQKGDLLVLEGGDVGRAAIWSYDFPMRIQNHIHRLRPYGNLSIEYFYHVFYLYKNAGMINGKGIGIKGLSSGTLHSLLVPLPPLAEQKRIVAKLEEILPLCERLK